MLQGDVPGKDKMMCSAVLNVEGRTRRTILQIYAGASVSALSVKHARLFKGVQSSLLCHSCLASDASGSRYWARFQPT